MSAAAFAHSLAPLRDAARAALPALTNVFSPTKNPCVVKVTPMKGVRRFRYDPYKAAVITPSLSPSSSAAPATVATATAAAPVMFPAAFPAAPHHAVAAAAASAGMLPFAAMPYAYYPGYAAGYEAAAPVAAPVAAYPMPAAAVNPFAEHRSASAESGLAAMLNSSLSSSTESVGLASVASTAAPFAQPHAGEKHYAIIKFKHDTYPYEAPFRVEAGDMVVVEGDRGEAVGTVKLVTTAKPKRPVALRVLRYASEAEREHVAMLRRKEQHATRFCENAVKESGLSMSVVDTEYQYDEQKLSIYFKAKGMVDFRRLQRVLFREFRCRVWLVNWNELVDADE